MMKWLVVASLAALSACGGGGGGDAGGSDRGSGSDWLSFSPSTVEATTYAGESTAVTVTVRWTKTVTESLNVALVDRVGVINPQVEIWTTFDAQGNPLRYDATLHVSPKLAAGNYTGNIEVRLCLDDAKVCAKPYPGSPWKVPYNFTVKSGTDLKPLQTLPGAGSWATYQGNGAHNGFVPAEVNPANFSRRFGIASSSHGLSRRGVDVAVEDGRIVFAQPPAVDAPLSEPWSLRAVSEATGQGLWSRTMDPLSKVGPPAVANGKVFVAAEGSPVDAFWAFDLATGGKIARSASSSSSFEYLSPSVHQGKIYAQIGNQISRYDASSSSRDWISDYVRTDYVKLTTPAIDDHNAYVCGTDSLYVLDPATGKVSSRIQRSGSGDCLLTLGEGGTVFESTSDGIRAFLSRYDVSRGARTWLIEDKFQSPAVLVGDVVYVNNGKNFDARSASTGALLWSWTAPAATTMDLVVVGNHAFVGTAQGTFAVDLRSRRSVWSYPVAGSLAVSANGVLYIRHPDGLVGINLH